jgi:hypothetical protein
MSFSYWPSSSMGDLYKRKEKKRKEKEILLSTRGV